MLNNEPRGVAGLLARRHHGEVLLEPNDLANLLALRNLRDVAASHARVPGRAQQDTAVLLLDAAIERAVFTACGFKQIDLGVKDTLETALSKLGNGGFTTPAGLSTDRMRLHKARNGVQHSGLSVDGASVPTWVVTTDRFIGQVVEYAYGVELDDVQLSDAIRDPKIKMHLNAAEAHLVEGDLDEALIAVKEAYDLAARIWTRFVESTSGDLRHTSPGHFDDFGIGTSNKKIDALQRVALLTSISPDPAEAIWFLSAMEERELLTDMDASRALAFVFTFATAVEASPAARREDRRNAKNLRARHVRQNPNTPARIESFSIGPGGWQGRADVTLVLRDVPDTNDFDQWVRVLTTLINDPEPQTGRIYVNYDGTITFYAGDDLDEVSDRIDNALKAVDAILAAERLDKATADEQFQRTLLEYNDRLAAMTTHTPDWIRLTAEAGWRTSVAPEIVLRVTPPVESPLNLWAMRTVIADAGGINVAIRNAGFVVEADLGQMPAFLDVITPALKKSFAAEQEKAIRRAKDLNNIAEQFRARGYPGVVRSRT